MKKNFFLLTILGLFVFPFLFNLSAQPPILQVKKILIVNGGKFEFSPPFEDYVTLTSYDTEWGEYVVEDTIYTQSAQDILVDSQAVFVAAGDSIVKYSPGSYTRLAATAFGAPSTIKMAVYQHYLLVGNWYGSSDNNLRIFNKQDLSFVDSIPELKFGAKDMIIIGDSLYVQQNFTNVLYEDSAGYLSVIDLKNLAYVRDIYFNNNGEDLGRLQAKGDLIYALNSSSNTITTYNVITGQSSTDTLPGDIQVNVYGQQSQLLDELLYFKHSDQVVTYNIMTGQIEDSSLVDSSLTAFIVDTLTKYIYATQTDFTTYTRGLVFHDNGDFYDTLRVGFSPEGIALIYDFFSGVEEQAVAVRFRLYPNPAEDQLNIDPQFPDPYKLSLYNGTGTLLYSKDMIKGHEVFDVKDLPPGAYLLNILTDKGSFTQKLIRQ